MSNQAQGCRLFPIYIIFSKGKDHRDRDWNVHQLQSSSRIGFQKSWEICGYLLFRCQLVAVWSKMKVVRVLGLGFPGCSWTSRDFFWEDLTMIWNWKHCQILWCEILRNVQILYVNQDYQMWSWYWNRKIYLRRPRPATIAPTCGRGPTVMSVEIGSYWIVALRDIYRHQQLGKIVNMAYEHECATNSPVFDMRIALQPTSAHKYKHASF